MATKAKDSSVVGKEKKAPSSSTKKNPTNKSNAEKQIPNYLKPTISSTRLDSHSSFKSDAPTKAPLTRRRSFDPSSSRLPKQTLTPSLSRQQRAIVSPGPRQRTAPLRSSNVPINASKPIPERLSNTSKEGRIQPLGAKIKSTKNVSSSTPKKVISGIASPDSINVSKNSGTTESEPKEATNEEIEHGENQGVDSDHDHQEEHDQKLEESDQPHAQVDDESVIPTELEQEQQKEEDNTNQEECNNTESNPEIDHPTAEEEEEVVEVKEEEQEKEKEEEEGGVVAQEDHKSETQNEEEVMEEKKEGGEEVVSEEDKVKEMREGQDEDEKVENEIKEENDESTKAKEVQEANSPVSNAVIEENAEKLLDERRNKVRALAGAFQNVIDHQKHK